MSKAIVVFSGGQDSVGMTLYLQQKGYDIHAITFLYGQKSTKEVDVAKQFAKRLSFKEHKIIDISFMGELYGSSNPITNTSLEMPSVYNTSIIIPIRNAIFLAIASAWAFAQNINFVAYGAHIGTVTSPDCRIRFTNLLEIAFNEGEVDAILQGEKKRLKLWSPAMENMSKADLLKFGYNIIGNDIFETWSCRNNQELHCNNCDACTDRKEACIASGITDKTRYQNV